MGPKTQTLFVSYMKPISLFSFDIFVVVANAAIVVEISFVTEIAETFLKNDLKLRDVIFGRPKTSS